MIGLAIAAIVFKLAQRVTSGCVIPFFLAGMVVLATIFLSAIEYGNTRFNRNQQRRIDRNIELLREEPPEAEPATSGASTTASHSF